MSILNLTPDSFSDGGLHLSPSSSDKKEVPRRRSVIGKHQGRGALIVDIGGQSTAPHASQASAEEEWSRVQPMLNSLTLPYMQKAMISLDTYRASVARQARDTLRNNSHTHVNKPGQMIINDISAGTLDPDMLPTIAEFGCTYIMMHMRGDPSTMNSLTSYLGGLIPTIAQELLARVAAAEAAGIRKWRIILDPGIGFAKTAAQNLEILRQLPKLRNWPGLKGMPWLVGVSRKGFIGRITGVEDAARRQWGTAAAVTAAVQGGADIVRVHDVAEMAKVVAVADAVYRGWVSHPKVPPQESSSADDSVAEESGSGDQEGDVQHSEARPIEALSEEISQPGELPAEIREEGR